MAGGAQVGALGQGACHPPQGQRQIPAEPGDLLGLAADPRRDGQQQVTCVIGLHGIQVHGEEAGQREEPARRDQQHAAIRRNQRLDLLSVQGVVHQQQRLLAVQDGHVRGAQLGLALRDLHRGMERPDDVRHGLRGRQGRVLAGTLQVQLYLSVGIAGGELLGQLQRQGRLADASHALNAGYRDAAALDLPQ